MENIELYVPKLDDYWYEEKIENDPLTMSYNAGFNVSYYGYHYDTGCIDFPKGKWKEKYDSVYSQLGQAENRLEKVRNIATQDSSTSSAKQEELKNNNILLSLSNIFKF